VRVVHERRRRERDLVWRGKDDQDWSDLVVHAPPLYIHEEGVMKYWLGVTDNDWFSFLSRAEVDEVNFWQPSGTAPFVGLLTGAPFLFKLKRPYNHVGGGGTFVKFSTLPLSLAWEVFGIKNGAASRPAFERMIRTLTRSGERDPVVGCTVLTNPFFWPENQWIADPPGWSGNIVRGKYYDTAQEDGAVLWDSVQQRMVAAEANRLNDRVRESSASRFGAPTQTFPRLGQSAFRVVVMDAYRRRCAITGESTLPTLEAAHILPFGENGQNQPSNGLLLRSDFHKLFDAGLVTVTPELRVEVSSRIKEEWFNGKVYYQLHGVPLSSVPGEPALRPSADMLRWHNENRFVA
jgi:putative restriction endonuclease